MMYDPPLPPSILNWRFRLLFVGEVVDSFIRVIFSYENIFFCTSTFDVGLRDLNCPKRYRLTDPIEVQGSINDLMES